MKGTITYVICADNYEHVTISTNLLLKMAN